MGKGKKNCTVALIWYVLNTDRNSSVHTQIKKILVYNSRACLHHPPTTDKAQNNYCWCIEFNVLLNQPHLGHSSMQGGQTSTFSLATSFSQAISTQNQYWEVFASPNQFTSAHEWMNASHKNVMLLQSYVMILTKRPYIQGVPFYLRPHPQTVVFTYIRKFAYKAFTADGCRWLSGFVWTENGTQYMWRRGWLTLNMPTQSFWWGWMNWVRV